MGTIRTVSLQELNVLLIHTQPAHLQKIYGEEMETEERDIRRADYAREKFNENFEKKEDIESKDNP